MPGAGPGGKPSAGKTPQSSNDRAQNQTARQRHPRRSSPRLTQWKHTSYFFYYNYITICYYYNNILYYYIILLIDLFHFFHTKGPLERCPTTLLPNETATLEPSCRRGPCSSKGGAGGKGAAAGTHKEDSDDRCQGVNSIPRAAATGPTPPLLPGSRS